MHSGLLALLSHMWRHYSNYVKTHKNEYITIMCSTRGAKKKKKKTWRGNSAVVTKCTRITLAMSHMLIQHWVHFQDYHCALYSARLNVSLWRSSSAVVGRNEVQMRFISLFNLRSFIKFASICTCTEVEAGSTFATCEIRPHSIAGIFFFFLLRHASDSPSDRR